MPRNESQPASDAQPFDIPLDGLPEGVTALQFPAQNAPFEEMSAFFGDLEGAIVEACDG